MQIRESQYFSYFIGGIIYMTGDTIAAFLYHEADLWRSIGIFAVGSTLYAFEIKTYFRWIDKKVNVFGGLKRIWIKTCLALIYFNPLWIARHLCIVFLLSGKVDQINITILQTAFSAFLFNIPVSVLANYIIQNKTPLEYRFWASAVFSGVMAIYYSMSSVWF